MLSARHIAQIHVQPGGLSAVRELDDLADQQLVGAVVDIDGRQPCQVRLQKVDAGILGGDAGVADPDALVDAVLAPISAEVYAHQRARGLTSAQITDALLRLAHGLLGDTGYAVPHSGQ